MQSKRLGPGFHALRLAVPLGLILLATLLAVGTRKLAAANRSPYPLVAFPRYGERAVLPTAASAAIGQAMVPVEGALRRGETIAQALHSLGLDADDAREAAGALAEHVDPRALRAGSRYSAFFNPGSTLASLKLTLDGSGRLELARRDGRWEADWQPFQRSLELRALRGVVAGSLESSIRNAGGPAVLAFRMAEVLQWDLDFARDLRPGDRFAVLYQEIRLDGDFHAVGNLFGLAYDNQGRMHEAYRFGDSGVYYDGSGRPLKKMFLRSPLRYSRITSAFSQSRLHPVLGVFRPHFGVDYAAPIGTPVEATANGVVLFAGWDGGGGNVVKVQNGRDYVTAFLHLSRFAAGIRAGARVRQGQVIAFTGATGLASGPHLDYRIKCREKWIDPLAVGGVRDEPIPGADLASFHAWRESLRSSMETGVVAAGLVLPEAPLSVVAKAPATRVARGGRLRKGGSSSLAAAR